MAPSASDEGPARPAARTFSPAAQLLTQLATELRAHPPFAQMAPADVAEFVAAARQTYYAPGEVVASPADGPAPRLVFIRRGAVSARGGVADLADGGLHYDAGDLFPAAAVTAARAVTATYEATEDLFCLEVAAETARVLAGRSAAWADFLAHRAQRLLELSRAALQAEQGAQALAEHSLESPLANLPRRAPVACAPGTPLIEVLRLMHGARVGSVLVIDQAGTARGILTRHDVLERVALARPPEDTPIDAVMSAPVCTLPIHGTAQQAALTMSRHGVRHLPLTDDGGRVVSVVSERDLFALQRLSLKHVSGMIRAVSVAQGRDWRESRDALVACGEAIRRLARHLLTQGLSARSLTEMLSHLNDLLTERIVRLAATAHGLDLTRGAWVAFGSEGRSEQTIATDQDNGLVLADDCDEAEHARWLGMAREVNDMLDACGYPLCKGHIMAGNPACCLRQRDWLARFDRWMEQGAPEDLLNASIYFDVRTLAGPAALVAPLRERITERARELPRFRKQLADNALRMKPALNWRGALDTTDEGEAAWIDLKMSGTAIFVDAARLFALATGVGATGTRERLLQSAAAQGLPTEEADSQVAAFDLLQLLRLRQQVRADADAAQPNSVDVNRLTEIDRRLLKEAMRAARALQQRIELDYPG
ncbi:MAG: CBS domain-containing protein [Rubrivivax sp.]|nr:CBS domain-containing protein [Rubrivivax sp.]